MSSNCETVTTNRRDMRTTDLWIKILSVVAMTLFTLVVFVGQQWLASLQDSIDNLKQNAIDFQVFKEQVASLKQQVNKIDAHLEKMDDKLDKALEKR